MKQTSSFRAMNTTITVQLENNSLSDTPESQEELRGAISFVQALFESVEQICSRFLPFSELQQLNASPEQHVSVSPILYDVLQQAFQAYELTGGIFNPGVLSNLQKLGYNKSIEFVQRIDADETGSLEGIEPITAFPYELDDKTRTVWLRHGLGIDLGGIAKGWTVDRAVQDLRHYGLGFVNAGGDIRFFGDRSSPWNVGIEDPYNPSRDIATLSVIKGGVATSSLMKRKWNKGTQSHTHIIDPTTGHSTTSDVVSATIVAPTATEADVWAKTLLVAKPDQRDSWIHNHKLEAVFVDNRSNVRSITYAMVK